MTIPDFTQFSLKYVVKEDVTVGGRTFEIRLVIETSHDYWPLYHLEDKTDDNHIGPKQRDKVNPVRSDLLRQTFAAIRAAGWEIDTTTYIMQAPFTHIPQALRTTQDGGWK